MTEIVKVQIPIFASPGVRHDALIYGRDRLRQTLTTVTTEMTATMKRLERDAKMTRHKGYFHATWTDGRWHVDFASPAPWQDW